MHGTGIWTIVLFIISAILLLIGILLIVYDNVAIGAVLTAIGGVAFISAIILFIIYLTRKESSQKVTTTK